ncbi:hypothetical protein BDV06DRAFT_141486 [Aspergillus oleicola]
MQDEARHTEGRNLWRSNAHFRHQAVKFISAGILEREKEDGKEDGTSSVLETSIQKEANREVKSADSSTTDNPSQVHLDLNAAAEDAMVPTIAVLPTRPRSPTADYSSEDEIVFRGRRSRRTPGQCSSDEDNVDGDLQRDSEDEPLACSQPPFNRKDESPDRASFISFREKSSCFIQPDKSGVNRHKASDEDEILADYIAHIDDDSSDDISSSEERPTDNETTAGGHPNHVMCRHEVENDDGDSNYDDVLSAEEPEDEFHHDFSSLSQFTRAKSDKSVFASATAFADALEQDPYYGLDVMDFSRSSLRKKKKKHDLLEFGDIDSELENELINAWDNDRSKKRSKKKEREELRAQGLLGRRKNDPDLKTKYSDGIGIEDLKSEIRLFLLSPKNSLSLPPMTKHRRVLIHDLAHSLRLTSQSRGKGSSRFPILSKTSRTPKYTHKTISQIDRLFSKERFSSRALKGWDKISGRSTKKKSGHGNVSYMDGEIVGASAPEIGAENKGRAMLEKMGWSTGTALGATNNKGILLPVAHIVKNSKAGLG